MIIRNIYRLTEYAQGDDGYLNSCEWPIYCLDACLMALVMATALFWYTIELHPKHRDQAVRLQPVNQCVMRAQSDE